MRGLPLSGVSYGWRVKHNADCLLDICVLLPVSCTESIEGSLKGQQFTGTKTLHVASQLGAAPIVVAVRSVVVALRRQLPSGTNTRGCGLVAFRVN